MSGPTINHYACFSMTDAYWALSRSDKEVWAREFAVVVAGAAERVDLYQVFPTRDEADLLIWSAAAAQEIEAPGRFFAQLAQTLSPHRQYLRPSLTLWGLTKPSEYTRRGGSEREIRPLAERRDPYLIVYPFVKSTEWYLTPEDERREMMREHIVVGRKHSDIRQLLLYSFGLQDQDFVVVYDTADLAAFSELVRELRGTESRAYTDRDTPIVTGIWGSPEDVLSRFR